MSIIYSFSNTNKMKDSEKKAKNLYNCHQCGNTIEKCDNCGELFDDASEGVCLQEGNEIGK